jgi:hypothetical protein
MNQIEDKVMRLQTRTTGSASDYDIGEGSEEDEVRLRLSRTRQAPKKVRQLTVLKGKKTHGLCENTPLTRGRRRQGINGGRTVGLCG